MRLTAAGKLLLIVVGLGVLGFAAWTYRGRLPLSPGGDTPATPSSAPSAPPLLRPHLARRRRRLPRAARKGVLASIRQTGVLRVGMEPDAPPMRFINDRKQDDGFDFRVAGLIADGSAPSACRWSRPTTRTCRLGCAPATST